MALFIPDISHHQGDISIQALKDQGAAALLARVGQGAGRRTNGQTYGTTQDRKWARDLAEARRVGLRIVPYWYIGNLISADENARLAALWVGDTSLPWMLDHEDASGSIGFYHEVLAAFARRGLTVALGYVPHWYWEGAGGRASLVPGPPLVSSRYSTANGSPSQIYAAAGGDGGAGWASYGGQSVALWQFTNKASLAGQAIDCSAFRGTEEQLAALLGGEENDMQPTDVLTVSSPGDRTYTEPQTVQTLLGDTFFHTSHMAKTLLPQLIAAVAEGDVAPDAILARLESAVREATAEAIGTSVLPALREVVHEVLGEDNAAQADAIVTRIAERLRPAA